MKDIKSFEQHLANLFRARFPLIYIETWEENRVLDSIKKIVNDVNLIKTQRNIYSWSVTTGLIDVTTATKVDNITNIIDTIKKFNSINENAILVLQDIHDYFSENTISNNLTLRRLLRDTSNIIKSGQYSKNIVLIAPVLTLPISLQKDVTVVNLPLPNQEEIKEVLNSIIASNLGEEHKLTEEEQNTFAKTAQGLTLQEAENAFARAIVERKRLTTNELDIIMDEKCQVIKKTGMLEYVHSDLNMDDVGGLENLKQWLTKRNNSWTDKAQKNYNLPAPKGVLITGIAGCGKSLTAKAMSSLWKLPLLRLDAGSLFGKYLGESEQNTRQAIKVAEAVAPSILWIDEIEKGFAQGDGESATTSRVLGTILTWMNEKTKPVFIIATANNINALPPEIMRKGRFDEIFFVDLPTDKERADIFKLHLNKILKGSISEQFEITETLINKLVGMTDGYTGSEIEQVIIASVFEAFAENRVLQDSDLYNVISNTVPLSVTQKEQIEMIRNWAKQRAVLASK